MLGSERGEFLVTASQSTKGGLQKGFMRPDMCSKFGNFLKLAILNSTFCPVGCSAEVARFRTSLQLYDAAPLVAAQAFSSDVAMKMQFVKIIMGRQAVSRVRNY